MGEKDSMKLLTAQQVGEILLFSPRKIRKMLADGEIPSMKIAGEYRVNEKELVNYLENGGLKA
jgi:excisionase family DNA binding protein